MAKTELKQRLRELADQAPLHVVALGRLGTFAASIDPQDSHDAATINQVVDQANLPPSFAVPDHSMHYVREHQRVAGAAEDWINAGGHTVEKYSHEVYGLAPLIDAARDRSDPAAWDTLVEKFKWRDDPDRRRDEPHPGDDWYALSQAFLLGAEDLPQWGEPAAISEHVQARQRQLRAWARKLPL